MPAAEAKQQQQNGRCSNIVELSEKCLLLVMQLLSARDVCHVARTCKTLRQAAAANALWEALFRRAFDVTPSAKLQIAHGTASWRGLYAQNKLIGTSFDEANATLKSLAHTTQAEFDRTLILLRQIRYCAVVGDAEGKRRKLEELQLMHMGYGNHAEAGMCALALAEDVPWPETSADDGRLTSLQGFSRRENLHKTAAKHFGDARYWERGILALQELHDQFDAIDLAKQSAATRQLIKSKTDGLNFFIQNFEASIRSKDRILENYFYVEFYAHKDLVQAMSKPASAAAASAASKSGDGGQSDVLLREDRLFGRKFVVKGSESERIGQFLGKLKARWPLAEITSTSDLSHAAGSTAPLIILVHSCKPVKLSDEFARNHGLPAAIEDTSRGIIRDNEDFAENVNVNVFLYSRPIRKSEAGKSPRAANLWVLDNYLVTSSVFPSVSRWVEVMNVVSIEKTPLETACDTLEAKQREIELVTNKAEANKQEIRHLSMVISGVVDAAVSGGIKNYIVAFLNRDFITRNPDKRAHIEQLCTNLRELLTPLARAIELHRKESHASLAPFQRLMETQFAKFKNEVETSTRECLSLVHIVVTPASPRNPSLSELRSPRWSIDNSALLSEDGQEVGQLTRQISLMQMAESIGSNPATPVRPRVTLTVPSTCPTKTPRRDPLMEEAHQSAAVTRLTPRPALSSDAASRASAPETPLAASSSASSSSASAHTKKAAEKERHAERRRVREEKVRARIEEAERRVREEDSAHIAALQREKDEMAEKLQEIQENLERIRAEQDQQDQQTVQDIAALKRDRAKLEEELAQARQTAESVRKESRRLAAEMRSLVDKNRALEERCMKLTSKRQEAAAATKPAPVWLRRPSPHSQQPQEQQQGTVDLKAQLAEAEERIRALEKQLSAVVRQQEDTEQRMFKAEQEAEERQRQCEQLELDSQLAAGLARDASQAQEAKIDELQSRLATATRHLQDMKTIEDGFRIQLSQKDEQLQAMTEFTQALKDRVVALEQALTIAPTVDSSPEKESASTPSPSARKVVPCLGRLSATTTTTRTPGSTSVPTARQRTTTTTTTTTTTPAGAKKPSSPRRAAGPLTQRAARTTPLYSRPPASTAALRSTPTSPPMVASSASSIRRLSTASPQTPPSPSSTSPLDVSKKGGAQRTPTSPSLLHSTMRPSSHARTSSSPLKPASSSSSARPGSAGTSSAAHLSLPSNGTGGRLSPPNH